MRHPQVLQELNEMIEAVQNASGDHASGESEGSPSHSDHTSHRHVPAPWGRLKRGVVHEWFAESPQGARDWTPPLTVLTELAWRAMDERTASLQAETPTLAAGAHTDHTSNIGHRTSHIEHDVSLKSHIRNRRSNKANVPTVWIGRRCWPYAQVMTREQGWDRRLLKGSVLIDPPDLATRVWAIDLALRCPAVAAVIADGSGLDMATTRRLQLAAEAGQSLALLARPPRDRKTLSAAATRWRVAPEPSPNDHPRWKLTIERNKRHAFAACGDATQVTQAPSVSEAPSLTVGARPITHRMPLAACPPVAPSSSETADDIPASASPIAPPQATDRDTARHTAHHTSHIADFLVEFHRGQGLVAVSANVVDRPLPSSHPTSPTASPPDARAAPHQPPHERGAPAREAHEAHKAGEPEEAPATRVITRERWAPDPAAHPAHHHHGAGAVRRAAM